MAAVMALARRPAPPPGPQPGRPRAVLKLGRARDPPTASTSPPPSPKEVRAALGGRVGLSPKAGPLASSSSAKGKPNLKGWNKMKEAVEVGVAFASLSVPFKTRRDEERMQRKHGSSIGPRANSPRWDIQAMYRELFFPAPESLTPDDPWGGEAEASTHWSAVVANDNYAARRARDRLHYLDVLKRKFKSASAKLAQDGVEWSQLFEMYDEDKSGTIGLSEFMSCVRIEANINIEQLSDKEILQLYTSVDTDGSGEISVEEFSSFMNKTTHKRPTLPVSGTSPKKKHADSTEGRTSQPAPTQGVPFIAEYIAMERIELRENPQIQSKVTGYIEPNEVVAVSQVWNANEMKVHRLKWNAKPSEGWTSHRGKNAGGRTSILLARLNRDEWSSMRFHETSVAHRISTLKHMDTITDQPEVKQERKKLSKSIGPDVHPKSHKSDAWVNTEFGVDDPEEVAIGALARCTTEDEVEDLLDLLERHPRDTWRECATQWEAVAHESRVRGPNRHKVPRVVIAGPPEPGSLRVFASLDRALVIHQIAEAKRLPEVTPEEDEKEHLPDRSKLTALELAVLDAHTVRREAAEGSGKRRAAKETMEDEKEGLAADMVAEGFLRSAHRSDGQTPSAEVRMFANPALNPAHQPAPGAPGAVPGSLKLVPAPPAATPAPAAFPAPPAVSAAAPPPRDTALTPAVQPKLKVSSTTSTASRAITAGGAGCTSPLWQTPKAPPATVSARCTKPPSRAGARRRRLMAPQ